MKRATLAMLVHMPDNYFGGEPFELEFNGKVVAVVVDPAEYYSDQEIIASCGDPDFEELDPEKVQDIILDCVEKLAKPIRK